MKAIIVTLYDPSPNFGNRLQNYAVQSVLKSLGFEIQTISYEKSRISTLSILKSFAQKLTGYRLTENRFYWECVFEKCKVFDRFNKNYINTVQVSQVEDIDLNSDYFVVGSDQVWNPSWYNNTLKREMFLLTFAPDNKKVCFAPSFGVEKLPDEWVEWFQKNLSSFPMISVREESGAKIVKELTGRDAEVVIDPTMMLSKNDWLELAKAPSKIDIKTPYLLTYFLGDVTDRVKADINKYADMYNLKVINLMDSTQPEVYISGPQEFIYLISHAQLVLTDSFHACVFSFLFEKPFLVYPRAGNEGSMISRIQTLLSKFKLERKFVDSELDNDTLEADYKDGLHQLTHERKKALAFLQKAMNINVQS